MKLNVKKGLAMPIIFGLILCVAIWIASLSWTMSNNRARYQQFYRSKQAYFMSRSALQHFFLKLKTIQRYCPESMSALEKANKDEWPKLAAVFTEDIIIPPDNDKTMHEYEYKITDFKIESVDYNKSRLTMQINALGTYAGKTSIIKRLLRISR